MPTYLCHGFRWHRRSIRYFVVIQDVEDASSEWIVTRQSPVSLLDQFYELFDFLPPCTQPTRNPSPSPQRLQSQFPTSNGHAHSRMHSYDSQEHKHTNNRVENGENGNRRRLSKSSSHSRSLGQPNTTHDDITPIPSPESPEPPELPEIDDTVPFNDWSVVKFLEEFDPSDLTTVSRPWAYVADYVVRVDMSLSIAEEISRYEAQMKSEPYKPMSGPSDEEGRKINTFGNKKAGWLEKLRDQLQRTESIRWYVVVCGDEERSTAELEERLRAKKEANRAKDPCPNSSTNRGIVENGFEFRLPEFLVSPPSQQGRRRRRIERKTAKQDPTPVPENDQPTIPSPPLPPPPPVPVQDAHKLSVEKAMRPKSSKSNGGLRKLFLRRKPDGPI
ncbi:hypothetical protein F5Y13DRAFT_204262 [Hypoxylon sp. FL1857]|nr:hypothetical protein F5Y13DRAFT_204262 [Hypoxylon sp. FL1857]